jgi:hypothetical protein
MKTKFGFDKIEWAMWLAMITAMTFAAYLMFTR